MNKSPEFDMLKELEEPGKERVRHLNDRQEKAPALTARSESGMQSPQIPPNRSASRARLVAGETAGHTGTRSVLGKHTSLRAQQLCRLPATSSRERRPVLSPGLLRACPMPPTSSGRPGGEPTWQAAPGRTGHGAVTLWPWVGLLLFLTSRRKVKLLAGWPAPQRIVSSGACGDGLPSPQPARAEEGKMVTGQEVKHAQSQRRCR